MSQLAPSLFIGHGNPMNVLEDNRYTTSWKNLGESIGKPRAILAISAHWYGHGIGITVATNPRTIHDFHGFPKALYEINYPAPGDPILADEIRRMLNPIEVEKDEQWGLDHGVWTVLKHMYPQADIPVVQLKIDGSRSFEFHLEMGKRLAPLREQGVLIFGSGNLVHNLRAFAWDTVSPPVYDWAKRFENGIVQEINERRFSTLCDLSRFGRDANLSVPTPDHYLPMLYTLGSMQSPDQIEFPIQGFDGGSISMLTILGRS